MLCRKFKQLSSCQAENSEQNVAENAQPCCDHPTLAKLPGKVLRGSWSYARYAEYIYQLQVMT